jgi:hypothetical protein
MKISRIASFSLMLILITGSMTPFIEFPEAFAHSVAGIPTVASIVTSSSTTIVVTFNEHVDSASADVGPQFTFSTGGTISSNDITGGSDTITLTTTTAFETDDLPTVTYSGTSVQDVAESSNLAGFGPIAATDGAPPTLSSATTTSSTTIDITFSEDIVDTASDLDDYTINGVAGGSDISAKSVSGAILTLTTNGYSILNGETVTVTFDGEANELEDTGTLNDVADFTNQAVTNNVPKVETKKKSSSDCYDCKPPTLQESHITILSNDYVVATGDDPLHITANVGDTISVILNVTDNKSVQTISYAALYTNFEERPSDMNLFYANNYDNLKQTSTSFYEWNVRSDDVVYDYDDTTSWSQTIPFVVTEDTTVDNFIFQNDDNVVEYFMVPFTFTINDHMESSQIIAKIYDAAGNRLHVTLPVTLETAGNEPPDFDYTGKQKVLGFYDESVLSEMISQWSESESDAKQLSSLLGISDESLPTWTSNLAKWVVDDKIDSADLIVAIEYLINQ